MDGRRTRLGVPAAAFLAIGLVGAIGGTAQAVASRTSDGTALASPEPEASAAAQAAAITAAESPGGTPDDLILLALGVIATGGLGRGLWLLRGRAPASGRHVPASGGAP